MQQAALLAEQVAAAIRAGPEDDSFDSCDEAGDDADNGKPSATSALNDPSHQALGVGEADDQAASQEVDKLPAGEVSAAVDRAVASMNTTMTAQQTLGVQAKIDAKLAASAANQAEQAQAKATSEPDPAVQMVNFWANQPAAAREKALGRHGFLGSVGAAQVPLAEEQQQRGRPTDKRKLGLEKFEPDSKFLTVEELAPATEAPAAQAGTVATQPFRAASRSASTRSVLQQDFTGS